jgi:hypothetical protein
VANLWLRPGNTASSNNIEGFIESTLENLGGTTVGLFRADSGFYDNAIVALLKAKKICHIISARLTHALQQAIVDQCKWQQIEVGLEVCELGYQPHGWQTQQRLVVVRQHIKRKNGALAGKTLSLFADDPDSQGWRYGAMLTDLSIPAWKCGAYTGGVQTAWTWGFARTASRSSRRTLDWAALCCATSGLPRRLWG